MSAHVFICLSVFRFSDYASFLTTSEAAFIFAFSPGHADMPRCTFYFPFSSFTPLCSDEAFPSRSRLITLMPDYFIAAV
jgi:hypothetical protein